MSRRRIFLAGTVALSLLAWGGASLEAHGQQATKPLPAKAASESGKQTAKAAPPAGMATPPVPVAFLEGAAYLGSAACKSCHAAQYKEWAASGHANMLRSVSPGIVKGDFSGVEIAYEGVEVEDAQKNKVKIAPKVRTETKDGQFYVTLLDAEAPANAQTYQVVEVLGSLWEQQYYLKVGQRLYPSPVRWVEKDKQWRKAPFAAYWWTADGTPDGAPRAPADMPAKQTVDFQCNGCHTTNFTAKKNEQGAYAFSQTETGIGCESCHGPGSKHVQAGGQGMIANPAKLGTLQQEQLCGQCHSRVTSKQDKDFAFPLGFKVGMTDLQDRVEFWTYSTRPANFWPNEDASKNRQQYHDTMRSGHLNAGVTCVTCHLDHATKHLSGSLRQPRDQQCVSCHTTQKAMYEGSQHAQKGVACVDCHMAKMGNRAGATQKTPKAPLDVTAHTMRPVTPIDAAGFKMRSSCESCHAPAQLAELAKTRGQDRMQVLTKTAELGQALQKAKPGAPGTLKAANVYLTLGVDGSVGAHNAKKALDMLEQARKELGVKEKGK